MIRHLMIALTLASCAHNPGNSVSVLERSDGLTEKPPWAAITASTSQKDGKLQFLGFSSFPGDVNVSAALNVSDEKALSEPMRSLVDAFLDQNQVGETLRDDTTSQRIISATRGYRPPMPGLQVVKRYWETVVITVGYESKTELRCYSLAEIPASEFSSAKSQYLSRLAGNQEIKNILKDVGEKQRDAVSH